MGDNHISESRQRTSCGGSDNGSHYGRLSVRRGYASEPTEAYYDLNPDDGTAHPRIIFSNDRGQFLDGEGRLVGESVDLAGDEVAELRDLISGRNSTGNPNAAVCRAMGSASPASSAASPSASATPSRNLTGWVSVPSLALGTILSGVCPVSTTVRSVDGFAGSTNDILAGGLCATGLALVAANAWEAPASSRGAHVVFDATQGTLLAASLVMVGVMDDARPYALVAMNTATSLTAGRLRSELSSPLWGDGFQIAAGVGMLVPGLAIATQEPQPLPAANLYRMPGQTVGHAQPEPSPEQTRFGLGLTLAGGFNLAVGATAFVWHLTHPRSTAPRARNWSLTPVATNQYAGAQFQLRF